MRNNGKRYVIRIKKNNEKIRLVTWFAFLTVLCLPFHTLIVGGFGLLLLIGVPLLVLSIPALLACIRQKSWDPATIWLAAFFVYNLLGYVWAPSFSMYSLYNYAKIIIIVACLYCQAYSRREKNFLRTGSVLSCLIVCGFMLTGKNIGYEDQRMTVAVFGVVQDPNYLGFLFLIPMTVAIQRCLDGKSMYQRVLYAAIAVIILFCVMLTGSRGAFLGLATVVAVCVIARFKKLSTKIIFCIAMALMIAVVYSFVLMFLPEHIAARFSIQDVLESRGTGRADIWMDAFYAMKKSPYRILFGFGRGSSVPVIGWATHNFIIQLILELGVVGTTLFLKFLWIWVKRLIKRDIMGLSVLTGCMAMAMTLSVNTNYYFWIVFILGIVCSEAKPGPEGG